MKVIIFGSTGSIGKQLVHQALALGHDVTAFARAPKKVDIEHARLSICQGDVTDPVAVARAISGHEAVLVTIGAGRKGGVRSAGTRNIIGAMEAGGVHRLICQSTLGVGESWGNLNAFWKYVMFGLLLRPAFRDHVEQEKYVRQSRLDWTIVRPGAFIDGELTREYRHGFPGNDRTTQLKISRPDVASFMLRQLEDDTYLRQAAGLSY